MKALILCGLFPLCLLAEDAVRVQKDIAFLGPDRKEKLDVYLPAETYSRPLPAVVFIHGGGWSGGSKHDGRGREIGETLAREGYVVFSVDYLLNTVVKDEKGKATITKVAWPQNFYDCKSAVRFVRKNAAEFGVDPHRIAVMGASAGAHLALLVGATENSSEMNQGGLYLDESNDVAAVIQFYGRYDVTEDRQDRFAGSTPEETRANAVAASPVTHLTKDNPPVLAVQGDADTIVPVKFGRRLVARLTELGVPHEYIEIPGAGHSFGLTPSEKDLRPAVLAFLKKYLGPAENK
jgi:acetyl esterase/lipase